MKKFAFHFTIPSQHNDPDKRRGGLTDSFVKDQSAPSASFRCYAVKKVKSA